MKCSLNDCTVHTVGEVRRCARCYDGTAEQIPAELADDAPLQEAIAARPGLGNRFKAGGAPAPEADSGTIEFHGGPAGGSMAAGSEKPTKPAKAKKNT